MLIGEHFTVTFRGDAGISETELKNAATWESVLGTYRMVREQMNTRLTRAVQQPLL